MDRSRIVSAPRDVVWNVVRDPSRYEEILGFGTWQPRDEHATGVGARYRIRLPVGSIVLGGEVEIVECDDHQEMAWHSVTGVDHRGRWRLRPSKRGNGTEVTLRLAYHAPGGVLGLMADYVSAVYVGRLLDKALDGVDRHARSLKGVRP